MEFSNRTWIKIALVLVIVDLNLVLIGWPSFKLYFSKGISSPSYPLIDQSRGFIDQEHFVVNFQPLREDLRELVAKKGLNSITLYFEFLNTGANISINPDLKIWPASLAKLPLAMAAIKKVENGIWSLNTPLVMNEEDKSILSGTLFAYQAGTSFAVENLIEEMLVHSDNTAYTILSRNMTDLERRTIIDETGLEELFDEEGKISSKEYSRLFRSLYTSSFLQRENSSKILLWLSKSDFSQYLSQGIGEDIVFANKYGKNYQFYVYANSGIVYVPNRPFIITVIIKGDSTKDEEEEEKKAQAIMAEISAKAYKYVVNYKK